MLTTVRCHYSSDTSALRPRSFWVSGPASWNAVPPRLRDPCVSFESFSRLSYSRLSSVFCWLTCVIATRVFVTVFCYVLNLNFLLFRLTTCLEKKEMSGFYWKSGKCQGIVWEKILLGKSCLKLFIVNCIFVTIQVFSRSLLCLSIWFWIMYCCIPTPTLERAWYE